MRLAAIDMGSNAIRLRIVDARDDGTYEVLRDVRAAVRIGASVFASGAVDSGTMDRACAAFKDFRAHLDAHEVLAIRAVATSAMRDATNGNELVERLAHESHIDVEIIPGIEEARIIRGALVRRCAIQEHRVLLVDVGGGSTELTVLEDAAPTYADSLPLGTVRLLAIPDPAARAQAIIRALETWSATHMSRGTKVERMIGTGGNLESLATLGGGPHLSVPKLCDVLRDLELLSEAERMARHRLRADRADTIVPAGMIFRAIAESLAVERIEVPRVGLRDGLIDELIEKFVPAHAQML